MAIGLNPALLFSGRNFLGSPRKPKKKVLDLRQTSRFPPQLTMVRLLRRNIAPLATVHQNPSSQIDPSLDDQSEMANFPCDPTPFLPFGFHIEHGWQRPARARVALGGEAPRRHEEYAILTLDLAPAPQVAAEVLDQLVDQLEHQFPVRVLSHFLLPLGLGLVQFGSPMQRQGLINMSPIPLGNGINLTVTKHDEGINLRTCNYSRICNIMLLGFPLDFQNIDFIRASVAPFGRLLH